MTIFELEQAYSGHVPTVLGTTERCAVLVPLVETGSGVSLLFEVRARHLKRQPGEVCFPGGRMEPGETATACALRETVEELGIPPAALRVIAPLDFIHTQSGLLLYPILAQVDGSAPLRPSADEVAETFLVPLSFFEETAPVVYTYPLTPQVGDDFPYESLGLDRYDWRGGTVEVPIYQYGGHAIWGMTGRIVRALAAG